MDFASYFEEQMEKSLDKEMKADEEYINSLVTSNDYLQAVIEFGFCLSIVPEEIKTIDFVSKLMNSPDVINLDYIPAELITYELCMSLVRVDGFSLYTVPNKYRDFNLCLVAVKNEHQAISHVPENLKDSVFKASISIK